MVSIFQSPKRRLWLIAGVVATVVILWLILAGGGNAPSGDQVDQPEEPPQTGPPDETERPPHVDPLGQPGSGIGGLEITADGPARVAVGQWQTIDLGTTPARFRPDQPGAWNITAYDPNGQKQQQVIYRLDPDRPQMIRFLFASSRRWGTPSAVRDGIVSQAWAGDSFLAGLDRAGNLGRLDLAGGDARALADGRIESVVWRDGQTYLHRTRAGRLTLVSPAGGWSVDGVRLLAGNRNQAAWVGNDGQVRLWPWADEQRILANIDAAGADELFLGAGHLYLFRRDHAATEAGADPDHSHPDGSGRLEIYRLDNGQRLSRVETLARPIAMAEIGGYSFWQVSDELYIVDNAGGAIVDGVWGFSRPVIDLAEGESPAGEPLIYLLTDNGEIWDFDLDRQSYNLTSQAPDSSHQPGAAVYRSLIPVGDFIYFGFLSGDLFQAEQTFRVRLESP